MKRKLLLAILPALLVLSSCQTGARFQTKDNILEDTTAHTELFGNKDVLAGKIGIRKRDDGGYLSMPKIGYQIHTDGAKLAIRFVAAVKDLDVKVEWKRGVASPNGEEVRSKSFNDAAKESTHYYTTLSNGSDTLVAGEGEFAGYVGFVVYSLYNITYDTYKDSYVAAYCTISELANLENKNSSFGLAVKIEKADEYTSANAFTFDPTVTAHFLQGKINGSLNSLIKATENPGGNNFAAYYGIHLRDTDSFGSFYYSPTTFRYFGYADYFTQESKYSESAELGGYVTPAATGTYNLYLSNNEGHHNHVYTAEGHVWAYSFGGFPIRLDACEDGGSTKYYIENIDVTAGQTLHIYKDGAEDSSVYTVKESVSNNNINTSKVIKNSGTASIYLNTDGGIWVSVPVASFRTINIDIGANWESQAGSHFHAWAWKQDVDGGSWFTAEIVGRTGTVKIPGHCDKIELIRYKSSTPSWDDVWDRTGTLTIDFEKTLTVTGWSYSAEFR